MPSRPSGPAPRTSDLPRPTGLVTVLAAVALEVLGLGALVVWGLVLVATRTELRTGVTAALLVFALVVAAGLAVSARALWVGRRAGRAPVATWQLLQGATALVLAQGTGAAPAWAVVVLSAAVFVTLLTPRVVAFTTLG